MSTPPTGTVSFLFTDVAGSTRLWEQERSGMSASLAIHDRMMRAAIEARGGHVFSIAGDSFGAAFATATDAVETAVRIQLELAAEDWDGPPIRVRMGIHTGTSEERSGNYFGPEVNRAARVSSAANGGQVLVSGVTAGLVGSDLPTDVSLVDRGVHSLKDIERPEHLFELRHPGLAEITEDLHTLDASRIHLPTQLSSFVGREREISEATELARSSRLVTLSGSGGTGKTRLAVEIAGGLAPSFRDGVWMVELAPIADPELVLAEIAELWRLRPGDGMSLDLVVSAHLADRQLLLVVDNCEHVLSSVADVVRRLLAACPDVSVIATSRESLGVQGETVYRVPSLSLSDDPDEAARSDAVRLFYERASRVRQDAEQTIDVETAVRICRRLDGIPLGIELAAARLRTLSAAELADRLDDSFRILSGGKGAVPRQRTLDTAIDWSHDLLDGDERILFRRLAAFSGGFDLAAAEVVCSDDRLEEWQVLDLLDQLVDKSLVVAVHGGAAGARFRLQEPVRQYASVELAEAGDEIDTRTRHARFYADWVAENSPRLRGPEQREANQDILREHDNIRGTLATLLAIGDIERHLWTCFHLVWFFTQSSLLVEGRARVREGLSRLTPDTDPAAAARGWLTVALLAVWLTDPEGAAAAEQGIECAKQSGETRLEGVLRVMRGVVAGLRLISGGDAEQWILPGLEMMDESDDPPIWEAGWDSLAYDFFLLFGGVSDAGSYRELAERLLDRAERLGDTYMASNARVIPWSEISEDNQEWALASMERAVEDLRHLGFRHGLGHALFYHGVALQGAGGDAIDELGEASAMLAEIGDIPCSIWSGNRRIGQLLDSGRVEEAGEALRVAAGRLASFDRDVDSDIAALACRWALAVGDATGAARLLGHADAHGQGGGLEACRADIASHFAVAEIDRLTTEGGSADLCQLLARVTT